MPDPALISPRITWTPIVTSVMEDEHVEIAAEQAPAPRRRRSLYGSILAFFGLGQAQGARKELTNLLFNFAWNAIQVRSSGP